MRRAAGGDGGGGFGAARRLPWHGYGGSGLRERDGDGGAEAAGGAGDEGDFVVEAEDVEDVCGLFCMMLPMYRGACGGANWVAKKGGFGRDLCGVRGLSNLRAEA